MKFENVNFGGKEVGPVQISIVGDERRGQELVGFARTLLGNMKNEMVLGQIKSEKRNTQMPTRYESGSLLHYMQSGELVGNAPLKVAATTMVDVTVNSVVYTASTIGEGSMVDTDLIEIFVDTSYNIKAEAQPKIVGFKIHFQDTTPYLANIEYGVSEPIGKKGEVPDYTNMRAWFRSSGYYDVWDGVTLPYYEWGDTKYNTYLSYDGEAAKKTAPSSKWFSVYPDDTNPKRIATNTMKTIYGEETQYIYQTQNGMYMTAADCFNHLYPKYTYEKGYVGAVAKTTRKKISESAVKYEPQFAWDDFWGQDEQVLTGNNLAVPKEGEFVSGWYGIMMTARRMEGEGYIKILGGFKIVFELDDGSIRTFDFTNLDLWSGHWQLNGAVNSPWPLTAGWYYAMFNPEIGVINLYHETNSANNPFTDPNGGRGSYSFFNYDGALHTDVWKDLKPVVSKSILTGEDIEFNLIDPATL